MLSALSCWAQSTMTFVVGNDVCTPITVTVGGSSYRVHSTLTITSRSGTVKATDCEGYKLSYDFGYRKTGNESHDTYTFHKTYDPNRPSDNTWRENSPYNSSNSSYNSAAYESGARAGQALGQAIFSLGGGEDGEAYPSLQLAPGISYARGENIKLRYTGYGFHGYGSIGKDYLSSNDYKDKILWNVGIGSYFAFGGDGDPTMDVSLGLSIGQLSTWEKLSLMIDVDYTYWIGRWRRIGIFGGGSIGWGSFTEVFNTEDYESTGGFAWNLEAGIVIRLANF